MPRHWDPEQAMLVTLPRIATIPEDPIIENPDGAGRDAVRSDRVLAERRWR